MEDKEKEKEEEGSKGVWEQINKDGTMHKFYHWSHPKFKQQLKDFFKKIKQEEAKKQKNENI